MRSPTYVVYKLVVFPLPVELCVGYAARERGEAATGVCVRAHFVDIVARPVTEQEVDEVIVAVAGSACGGNAPSVEACTVAGKDFKFSAVVALEDETLHRANRPRNNRKIAHDVQDRKKVEKELFCEMFYILLSLIPCIVFELSDSHFILHLSGLRGRFMRMVAEIL